MGLKMSNSIIFDFETLSTDRYNCVVVSLAALKFSEDNFTSENGYSFDELVESAKLIKFNVQDQVKNHNRVIDKKTLEWWNEQGTEAKKQLIPSDQDQSITELYDFFVSTIADMTFKSKVYTRGNNFDPIIFENIMDQLHKPHPYSFWQLRDTRSIIEGLSWGSGLKNSFMPEGCDNFIHHDPVHDIALDVMRMQTLVRAIS
jgi:hypothetical protein